MKISFLIVAIVFGLIGYVFGCLANRNLIKFLKQQLIFYENMSKKQAVQIEKIKDRLVYVSLGELDALVDYMMDDSEDGFGADENYPVLAIVSPLEEINLD